MRYPNAAKGLRLMFLGRILTIAAILLIWVPLLGLLLAVAATALEIAGIYTAGTDDENYKGALVFAVLSLAASLVSGFLQPGLLTSLLDAAGVIFSLLVVFSVCSTTSNLLHGLGQEALSQRGALVVKIYAVCTAVAVVCAVLSFVPIINIAAALGSAIASLAEIAGDVMYLLFLNSSSKALG